MTITTAQLDELERFARSEQKSGWPKCAVDFDVTLHLIRIARAALAWRNAKCDKYNECGDGYTYHGHDCPTNESMRGLVDAIDGEP